MKEIFEHAYKGFLESTRNFYEFICSLGNAVLILAIYLTLPLWIVPYAIHKHRKGDDL